jgi:arsenate reductase-like glutaredoxin family protein
MELSTFGQGHINYKVISAFKKDFWKEFNKKSVDCKDEEEIIEIEVKPKKVVKKSKIVKPKKLLIIEEDEN